MRCVKLRNFTLVKHNDPVRVEDSVYSMGNGDNGSVVEYSAS